MYRTLSSCIIAGFLLYSRCELERAIITLSPLVYVPKHIQNTRSLRFYQLLQVQHTVYYARSIRIITTIITGITIIMIYIAIIS